MAQQQSREPIVVHPEDVDPQHRWERPLQAPGQLQVDFEERVDFRRLHRYRLGRTRQALARSGLGALLCFDQHNIRYISSTVIGEWARDKLIRYCLLTGNGDPYVWDFGSAARHHRLYAPWLKPDHCRAGNTGMRGAISPNVGLFEAAAKELKRHYRELSSVPGVLIPSPSTGEGEGGGECRWSAHDGFLPPHPNLPPPGGKGQNCRVTRRETARETYKTYFR